MIKILCSTGALIGRPNGRNYKLLESLSKQLTCDGFEFMMYDSWYSEVNTLKKYLQELNLYIPVVHCEKSIGEIISKGGVENFQEAFSKFETNCNLAQDIGAEKIVIHLWNGITSDQYFRNNLNAYAHLKEISYAHHLDLLVENVVCNQEDPMKHWCELTQKYPDIHFVFDTKMAAFHQQLDLLYQKEYDWLWKENHICHYHTNDYSGGYKDWKNLRTLPIGKGNVDWNKFFEFITTTGYDKTFTIESTAFNSEGIVDIQMLNEQVEYIRKKLK